MKKFLLLGLLLVKSFCINAQQTTPVVPKELRSKFDATRDSMSRSVNNETILSQSRQFAEEQFKTAIADEKGKQATYQDEDFKMKHRWRSYTFQYYASIIIFILVIGIVITGIVFSGIQFRYTLRQLRISEKVIDTVKELPAITAAAQPGTDIANPFAGNATATQSATEALKVIPDFRSELELSATGLKVNSSVLGVIILALSIAFLYLYLIYVYPIKINPSAPVFNTVSVDSIRAK